jgi:general secretion pathway protein M
MTLASLFPSVARQKALLAAFAYVVAVAGLLSAAAWIATGVYEDSVSVAALRERLAQLDARVKSMTPAAAGDVAESGSPFIEGATITQAGATLQQRVERAVARAGGSLLSSQVDLEGDPAKTGIISLVADIDIAHAALQGFLYDLEAGMPYLFVDTLSVQSPQTAGDQETSQVHVSIGVSGQWEGRP